MIRYYKIGKLCVSLESDTGFYDTDATRPFLCDKVEEAIKVIFLGEHDLPLPKAEKIFESATVHVYRNDNRQERVFILPASDKAAAVITKDGDGYRCRYDNKYTSYFSNAVNLLNAVGLEKMAFDCGMYYLHCSFVELNGKAVLFSGASGVGKSTRAEMFERYQGARIINHDKALLYFENGKLTACGSPISGSSSIIKNEKYPVEAIVFLKKGRTNRTERCKPGEAIKKLLKNTVINTWDEDFYQAVMEFSAEIASSVKIFESECDLSPESVEEQRKGLNI